MDRQKKETDPSKPIFHPDMTDEINNGSRGTRLPAQSLDGAPFNQLSLPNIPVFLQPDFSMSCQFARAYVGDVDKNASVKCH